MKMITELPNTRSFEDYIVDYKYQQNTPIKIGLKILEIHNSNNHVNPASKENIQSLKNYYFQISTKNPFDTI